MAIGPRVIRNPLILVMLSAMAFLAAGAFCYVGGSSCSKQSKAPKYVQRTVVHQQAAPVIKRAPVVKKRAVAQKRTKGWLGVQIRTFTPENAKVKGMSGVQGVSIMGVLNDYSAQTSGFARGDVVTHFNGMAVQTAPQLKARVAAHKPGMRVPVRVIRQGTPVTLYPTLGEAPANMPACKSRTR